METTKKEACPLTGTGKALASTPVISHTEDRPTLIVTEIHACHYCSHVGPETEVIPAEYYDSEIGRDCYHGWACKDIDACLDREVAARKVAMGGRG